MWTTAGYFWDKLDDTQRNMFGSVPVFYCRSIGRSTKVLPPSDSATYASAGFDWEFIGDYGCGPGPLMDYAMVAVGNPSSSYNAWWGNLSHSRHGQHLLGPFRISSFEVGSGNSIRSWTPRDTFARWSDGTSNQILIGEKHFSRLYSPAGDPVTGAKNCGSPDYYGNLDWSYMASGEDGYPMGNIARTFDGDRGEPGGLIAVNRADGGDPDDTRRFGAVHGGSVCNFLVGDGSVHSISATTASEILWRLSCVNDGVAVSLP